MLDINVDNFATQRWAGETPHNSCHSKDDPSTLISVTSKSTFIGYTRFTIESRSVN